jgi:deoxyribonuclease (pyrimidine dimer)
MTRINIVPVQELSRQHLIAEYREIVRVFALARSSQYQMHHKKQPSAYTLGAGHVMFFYDKLKFVSQRYDTLCEEMIARGYTCNRISTEELHHGIEAFMFHDYRPTEDALRINRERILLRTMESERKSMI